VSVTGTVLNVTYNYYNSQFNIIWLYKCKVCHGKEQGKSMWPFVRWFTN